MKCEAPEYEPKRWWIYRPRLYWSGWRSLSPLAYGSDEWHRWTLVLGWHITGQVVIACGEPESNCDCEEDVPIPWWVKLLPSS